MSQNRRENHQVIVHSKYVAPRRFGPGMDHTTNHSPRAKREAKGEPQFISKQPILRQAHEWHNWHEVTVRIRGLRHNETTYNLFENFKKERGEIVYIEMYENRSGQKDGNAKIIFSPPPFEAFWLAGSPPGSYQIVREDKVTRYMAHVSLDGRRKGLQIQSPLRKHLHYDPKMKLPIASLKFGIMVDPQSMMTLAEADDRVSFEVNLLRKQITGAFSWHFRDPRQNGATSYVSTSLVGEYDRINQYQFQIPFDQLKKIQRINIDEKAFELVLSLESPPQFYRKREDPREGHTGEGLSWSRFDTWFRQTDVVFDPYSLSATKVALHKEIPVIDIGRWTTYVFKLENSKILQKTYNDMMQALQDFNIDIVPLPTLRQVQPYRAGLWSMIDPARSQKTSADLHDLHDLNGNGTTILPFEVRYQLEVCISREIINEYNITEQFVRKLAEIASQDAAAARNILEYVAGQDKRVYDPIKIFEDPEALSFSAKTEIPHYCAYARKATVTPSTIYFSSPTVETTNRVIRYYSKENTEGRFLRVQFTDELLEGRINSCADKRRNDELFTRIYRTLFNGIQIGERHYQFLAFGNSQFRENGAYFFCPTDHLSCEDIRQWMGSFSHINVVAKYAARLGQCFSTTRAINGLSKPDIVKIADIETKEYCWTDGVGKISPFLAKMIAAELGIRSNTAPSAFQFRLGGCKGILAVWPDAKEKEVHIRKSQQKFTAVYNGLEIIRCSRFSCATLNRQTITILSALGVPDEVFLSMLTDQLANYQRAMNDDDTAVSLLLRYIDDNQMTINIATMIRNGFMAQRDPFVLSMLHLWRAWSIKLLKEKAKIIVENGALVLGCVDETGTLRGYKKPKVARGEQFPEEELPQIFIQVPSKDDPNRYNVIEGICLVGRNPSLHPGDLRVVQAVNVPALHHLEDVVVFPSTGERDVPSMCSGGDLDGDDFFVIWDKDLRPREWNCDPMNYAPPKPKTQHRPVEISDLMKFFVRFMKNDSLPSIAHAHLAQSDFLNDGIKDARCLELAALHSKAVDYVKTGEAAEMPKRLRPSKYPHFMEKKHKPKEAQYHSDKILGQLYDCVELVNFVPQYEEPFDRRILRAYDLPSGLLKSARQIKSQYDTAMRRLLAQQEIQTEFEIWSTFVLSRPRVGSDYKVQEEIARLSDALKDQFRAICIEKAGSKDFSLLGPFVAGMYKVTKEELDIALAECRSTKTVGDREVPRRKMEPKFMPLISFPWLFEKELGRIATGIDTSEELDDLGIAPLVLNEYGRSRARRGGGNAEVDDFITQENGVIVHRGETLDLFRDDDSEEFSGDSDYGEVRSVSGRNDHTLNMGESGEVVPLTHSESIKNTIPKHLLSGTGVEDVVPRTELDGFVHALQAGYALHESVGGLGSAFFNDWYQVPPSTENSTDLCPPNHGIGHTSSKTTQYLPGGSEILLAIMPDTSLRDIDRIGQEPAGRRDSSSIAAKLDSDQIPGIEITQKVQGPAMDKTRPCSLEGDAEEEVGKLSIEESPSEKLSWMLNDEELDPDEYVTEEEVIKLDIGESPLEKLARLIGS